MNRVDKRAFGGRVAARRKALGLSQEALAQMVGMKQQGIDSIESGEVSRPRLLREIAATLRTTEQWLLWKEGREVAPPADPAVALVPLLSPVSAGQLADADSQIPVEDVPLLTFADLGRGDFFALKVAGDSMDRLSPEGSVIVVNRADRELVADKPYVFAMRGEATFKLWQPEPPHLAPFSTNPMHKPIFIKGKRDLVVIGRVRRTVMDL